MRMHKTCIPCIRRKVRCSQTTPCSQCIRIAETSRCVYEEQQKTFLQSSSAVQIENAVPHHKADLQHIGDLDSLHYNLHPTIMPRWTNADTDGAQGSPTSAWGRGYRHDLMSENHGHPKKLIDFGTSIRSVPGLCLPPISCLGLPLPDLTGVSCDRRRSQSNTDVMIQVPRPLAETKTSPAPGSSMEISTYKDKRSSVSHSTPRIHQFHEHQKSSIVSHLLKKMTLKCQARSWDKVIVQELRSLKEQRVTWRRYIAVQRRAMPNITALRQCAEQAIAEETKLARMAEEAGRKAEDERRKVRDAMEQEYRLKSSEQGLSQNRHRAYHLMRQLGLDVDNQSISKLTTRSV